jgi:hypothetical protein
VRLALRIYFQRIEVTGVEHVPLDTPVIFVLNHPNALVDPVFLLCLAPRTVSFLAKAPLFRMPVIGYLVKHSIRCRSIDDRTKAKTSRKIRRHSSPPANCSRAAERSASVRKAFRTMTRLEADQDRRRAISLAAVSTGEVSNLKIVPPDSTTRRKHAFAATLCSTSAIRST